MATKVKKSDEHMFSIELKSTEYVKSIALQNAERGNVLIEGFLGKLMNLNFTEGLMLEINGTNGSLRMDFSEEELRRLLPKGATIQKNAAKEV